MPSCKRSFPAHPSPPSQRLGAGDDQFEGFGRKLGKSLRKTRQVRNYEKRCAVGKVQNLKSSAPGIDSPVLTGLTSLIVTLLPRGYRDWREGDGFAVGVPDHSAIYPGCWPAMGVYNGLAARLFAWRRWGVGTVNAQVNHRGDGMKRRDTFVDSSVRCARRS